MRIVSPFSLVLIRESSTFCGVLAGSHKPLSAIRVSVAVIVVPPHPAKKQVVTSNSKMHPMRIIALLLVVVVWFL